MNPLNNIPPLKKIEEDPIARSIAKEGGFMKPASFGKPGAPTNQKNTRIRPMNWKRGRGRPRIHPKDKRDVTFF